MSTRKKSPRARAGTLGTEASRASARRLLLVGDETAVADVCGILETLPRKSRGRAFIEVASAADIVAVDAPGGITVCWLTRDSRGELAPGVALDRAVRAWLSEMIVTAEQAQDLSPWITGEAESLDALRRLIAVEQAG